MNNFATVTEGLVEISAKSDLSRSSNLVGRIRYEASSNPRQVTMQCVATQHLAWKKGRKGHPTTNFCQSVPNTPMNVGDSWATIGRAASNAGQRSETDVRRAETQHTATSRSGGWMIPSQREATIPAHTAHNLGNPYAEKEARLRSQLLLSYEN